MNRIEVGQLLDKLAEWYPQTRPFTESTVNAWHDELAHVPADVVYAVLPDVRDDSPDFCPPLPKIIRAIRQTIKPKVDHQMGWSLAMKAIEKCGIMHPDRCRDWIRENCSDVMGAEAIIRAADTIGWRRLGLTPFNEHTGLYAQFRGMLGDTMAQEDRETLQKAIGVMADEAKAIGE
jgi:hypothetical protein